MLFIVVPFLPRLHRNQGEASLLFSPAFLNLFQRFRLCRDVSVDRPAVFSLSFESVRLSNFLSSVEFCFLVGLSAAAFFFLVLIWMCVCESRAELLLPLYPAK